MLTGEEMREYIEMAERDEWDPSRWRFTPNPRKNPLFLVVDVSEQQEEAIEVKAKARGQESDEYLDEEFERMLAMA